MPPGPARRGLLTFVVGAGDADMMPPSTGRSCLDQAVSLSRYRGRTWLCTRLFGRTSWQRQGRLRITCAGESEVKSCVQDPNLAVIELEGEAFLQAVHSRKNFVAVASTAHLPQPLVSPDERSLSRDDSSGALYLLPKGGGR